jgi:hypothetical protein
MCGDRVKADRSVGGTRPCHCGCDDTDRLRRRKEAAAARVALSIDAMSDGEFVGLLRASATKAHRMIPAEHLLTPALLDGGAPLEPPLRRFMERRFAQDFGFVRVHAGAPAAEVAASLGTPALAIGNHVLFGRGQYDPDDFAGRRLIAHELTHLLQQKMSGGAAALHSHAGHLHEAQAEEAALAVDALDRAPVDILRRTPLLPAPVSVQTLNPILVRCGAMCTFTFAPEGVLIDPRTGAVCGLVDCGQPFPPGPRAKSWCAYNCAGQKFGAFVINTVCGPVGPFFTDQFVN